MFEAYNDEEIGIFFKRIKRLIKGSYIKNDSMFEKENIIIQEKIKGREYGLDVINDLNGKYCNTVVKYKYGMRSGETESARVINNDKLKQLGKKLSTKLSHIANLDVDLIMKNNIPYIIDMNPRFGGGYPFTHLAGVNLPFAIIKWINNELVDENILKEKYGIIGFKDMNIIKINNTYQ